MRKRSLCTVTAAAVLLSLAAVGPAAAAGKTTHAARTGATAHAAAKASGSVTVSAFGGLAVDGALHRVFVGDSTAGSVTAADYSGNSLTSVGGLGGVSDLTVSTDGATLYAALPTTHEVVSLDATTLAVKSRYAVATTVGPTHVAFTAGKLWFTYGDQWSGNLGSVDPSAAAGSAVTLAQITRYPWLWNPALMSVQPTAPGVLALGETGLSSDSMAIVDVSSGTPQVTAFYNGDYSLNQGINDISLIPGATPAVLVNGSQVDTYANGKFTHTGSYPNANVGTVSPDGYVAQASGSTISVFKANTQTPVHTFKAGYNDPVKLAWAPDDSRVFAMTGQYTMGVGTTSLTLQALTDPTKFGPTLTASVAASANRGSRYTVSGKLSSSLPIPAGTQLSVTRVDLAHPSGVMTAIKPVTAADGSWRFTDSSSIGGRVTYEIGYAGDALHASATASATITIARAAASVSVSTNSAGYGYNGWAHVTAHLGKTWNNHTVGIYVIPTGMPETLVASGKVDRYGNFSTWYRVTRDTRFIAWFSGDYLYGTAGSSRWVHGYASIGDALFNSYGSKSSVGHKFQLFHKSKLPVMGIGVAPNKGNQCITLYAQWYHSGRWQNLSPQGFCLGNNGVVYIKLDVTHFPLSSLFRFAPLYGGDGVNSPTWGNWLYFSVTR